jgi:membrane fusion protein (multidrug efflux system)
MVENTAEATSENPKRQARLNSPRLRRLLLLATITVLVAGGLWFYREQTYGKYQQSTNNAYVQSDAIVVSSKLGGIVARVFVVDNQRVKRGDPLVQIDSREYDAEVRQAEAQIGIAVANTAGVRAQIHEQQAAIDQARAQLAAANGRLEFSRGEVARFGPLVISGAESRERLAQLRDQERQAAAQVASARAQLVAAQRRVGTLDAQIGQAMSQRRAAEAQLSTANVNLGATIIRASANGRVGSKTVQVGQFVQPGVRLMSIVPVQQLYVEANFKETQLGLMRVGQPVRVRVDALDDAELRGRVESFSPGTGAQFSLLPPQNATGNFTKIVQRVPVRISIDVGPEASKLLLPGMSAVATVDTRSAKGAREIIEREQELRASRR